MARRGDGIYLRGKTWWLDFMYDSQRHVARQPRARGPSRPLQPLPRLGKYDGDKPVVKVRQVKESAGRLRYLEGEEIDALLAGAREPMIRTLLLVAIYTGIRIHSEALTLRWADLDLKRGLLTVQSAYAESGKTRTVPLNRPALAALRALRERTGDRELVFARRDGSAYRSIRTAFQTACRRAGLKNVTPHVLRHTFASRLAMTGAHPRTIPGARWLE